MLHKSTFQNNVRSEDGKHENELVLHAMAIGASRYDNQQKPFIDMTAKRLQQACDHVVLMANQSLDVKNLQALIILAFRYVSKHRLVKTGHQLMRR